MLRFLRLFSLLLGLLLLVLGLPVAPLAAATAVEITRPIATNADDGMSGPWGFYRSLSWFEAGNPGAAYNAWFRFTGITIPRGATILAAHLEVSGEGWDSGTKLKISADKAAAPTAPTSTNNHKSKVRTSAGVAWTTGYADWSYHSSPDFAAVIQELVSANAYNNGAIQILVDNNGGTGEAVGGTREDGRAARLYIKYQTGATTNTPPVLAAIGNKAGTAGQPLGFAISATDADGDTLTYAATGLPTGATLNSSTGAFAWPAPVAGTYSVTFSVADGKGGTDSEAITITINPAPTNTPPVLAPIGNRSGTAGQVLSFTISATDADNDPLTFAATGLPANATLDATMGAFSWPSPVQGTYNVTFSVADGRGGTDSEAIVITISAVLTYTLDITIVGNGSVAKSPDQAAYAPGTVVTLTAHSGNYYSFAGWSGDATGTTSPTTLTMDGNKHVTATFIRAYPMILTLNISGQGTVTRSPDDPNSYYLLGTVVTLTAAPAAGWSFAGWSGGLSGSANPAAITMDSDKTVTATFTQSGGTPVEFTKSIAGGANDGFSGPWGFYSDLVWYEVGNPGQPYHAWFRFTGITIPKGATILEARLEVVQTRWDGGVRLKISADRSAAPTAPTSTSAHNAKTRTTANVAWNSGYADSAYHNSPDISAVIQELVNANAYSNGAIQLLVDNSGSNGEAVGRTFEYGAAPRLYIRYQSGGAPPANHAPFLDPIGDRTGTAGTTLSFGISATDADGDALTYAATGLPAGATLNSITGAFSWPSPVAGTYDVAFSVSDGRGGTDSESITITISPAAAYTLTVSIVGQGTVTKSPNQATYAPGTSVRLAASPAAGWLWSGWSGDASGSANPLTITMNANKTVTASFVPSTWWNGGWTYRRDIAITERSGTALSNYQVRLAVPYVSGMRADFADLRFIDSDDTTPLSCWCESFTQGAASVWWVKVPSLPASGVKHIWLYYGNDAAVSASEIHATFIWADDFNNPAWTAGNVQQVNYGECGQSVGGGIYTQWGVAAAEPIGEIYRGGALMQLPAAYITEVSFRPAVKTGGAFICPLYTTVADKYECLADIQFNAVALNKVVGNAWSMISWIPTSVGMDVGRWFKLTAVVTKEGSYNRLKVLLDDTQYVDALDSSLTFPGLAFLTYDMESAFNCSYDNFRVRAYASAEPTAAIGAEERLAAGATIMVPVLPERQEEAAPPPLPVQNLPARRAPPAVPAADPRQRLNDGLG